MTQLLAPIDWVFWIPRIAWFLFGGAVGSLAVFVIGMSEPRGRGR